jgi:trehalose 6-phosphate phosphatase
MSGNPDRVAEPGAPAEVLDRLAGAQRLLVAVDFDGVLAPIVPVPAEARALPAGSVALSALASLPATTVAVISGRGLADLRMVSGLTGDDGVRLIGSHGAEPAGVGLALDDAARDLLVRLRAALVELAGGRAGVQVEEKPAGAAVHVRRADPDVGAAVLDAVRAGPASWDGVAVTEGKAVIDLAVVKMDKGAAVDMVREQTGAGTVLFLGDDVTDERAFAVLRETDVGIKVGPGETLARYRVPDPTAVADLLGELAARRHAHRQ